MRKISTFSKQYSRKVSLWSPQHSPWRPLVGVFWFSWIILNLKVRSSFPICNPDVLKVLQNFQLVEIEVTGPDKISCQGSYEKALKGQGRTQYSPYLVWDILMWLSIIFFFLISTKFWKLSNMFLGLYIPGFFWLGCKPLIFAYFCCQNNYQNTRINII